MLGAIEDRLLPEYSGAYRGAEVENKSFQVSDSSGWAREMDMRTHLA